VAHGACLLLHDGDGNPAQSLAQRLVALPHIGVNLLGEFFALSFVEGDFRLQRGFALAIVFHMRFVEPLELLQVPFGGVDVLLQGLQSFPHAQHLHIQLFARLLGLLDFVLEQL
jgi:hypothetical protein